MNWFKMAQFKKELVIMRGVSGSGKSYKARQIAGNSGIICSADDFFIERGNGKYLFDQSLLSEAHNQAKEKAIDAINKGVSPVVIDNTNTRLWELKALKPIISLAQTKGYSVRIEEPETEWWKNKDIQEMAKRNSHGVPISVIEKMVDRFHPNVTIDDIMRE